jgi:hypothetical protein
MSRKMVRIPFAARALAPALAFTLLLSGCGAGDEIGERLTEEAVEEAAGGDADVDIDEEGLTVTDENGDSTSIGTDLPEDFPVDDVPLMEGTVLAATAVDGASYTVTLEVEGAPEEVHEQALAMLTDAGYTRDSDSEMNAEGFYTSTLAKEGFEVSLTSMDNAGTTNVQYIVGVS